MKEIGPYVLALFLDFFAFPSMAVVNNCLLEYLEKHKLPYYSLRMLSKLVDNFLQHESDFEFSCKDYSLGPFMLNNPNYDIYEEDKILKMFKIMLSEDRLCSDEDIKCLVKDCLSITRHNECYPARIVEVMQFMRLHKVENIV